MILTEKPFDNNPFAKSGSVAELFAIARPLIDRAKTRELILDKDVVHGMALLAGFRNSAELDDTLHTNWEYHEREHGIYIQAKPPKNLYSVRVSDRLAGEDWEKSSHYHNKESLIELGWIREAIAYVPLTEEDC